MTNVLTGVAIDGYDPVSYFTGPEPRRGSPQYVHEWAGIPWYFASAANRDVFARAPEIYAPLFGGHGAMAMSRGYLSDGNPQIYRIVGDRLLLFFSVGNREAFDLAGPAALAQALDNWERLPPARGAAPFVPPAGAADAMAE
ncbi:YHS domain-containing (seleno)protein [Pelagibacterium xiamenense]|uniref:YHS domain-containing (seleno)protein n=1 Tax=Pelagibacterium xiamenense TaxID=2901140 RepID=UPI001E495794|nr:twin-arginine translocation pathway signal protein [Pelagibacterium xiamenense]